MRSLPVLVLLLGLSSCEADLDALPPLTMTGFEPRTVEVTAGVPYEWEATFRDENGALVEPEELSLLGTPRVDANNPDTPTVLMEDTVLEPGRHRYRATPIELKTIRIGIEHRRIKTDRCPACAIQQELDGITLHVNPPAEQLLSLSGTELSLGVGERRAVTAFPWGVTRGDLARSRIAWAWDGEVTLASSAPAVARVENGRVVGVGPGTASVTLSSPASDGGVLSATLSVTVTDAGVGPPPEGLHPVFAQRIDSNEGGLRHLQPPLYRQLQVDPAGNPVTVGVLFGNLAGESMRWLPALIGQWTGTGFETLRLGRVGEQVRAPRLVIDERGRRYAMYRDVGGRVSSSIVVADFDANSSSRDVRYRDLPVRDEPRAYEEQRDVTTWAMDLAPRKGGGAWAAWVHLEGDLNSGPSICTVRVRLAELTDDGVRVQDVGSAQTLPKESCNSGVVYGSGEDTNAKLSLDVLSRPNEPPTIDLHGLPEFGRARFTFEAGQWVKTDADEPLPWPGGWLVGVPDDFWPDGITGAPEPFRFDDEGRRWYGNEHPGILLRDGNRFDDPTPRWFEGLNGGREVSSDRRQWLTQGLATASGRLHQAIARGTDLRYGAADLPSRATPTSPETTGVRLADSSDPWLPVGLSTVPSGARFVELRLQNARIATQPIGSAYNPWVPTFLTSRRVLRSPAPGQPFAEVTLPAGVRLLPPVIERGGKLWALGTAGSQLHVLTSTDGGQVFTTAFTQAVAHAPSGVVAASGVLFALCAPSAPGDAELWRFDVDVAGFAPRQLGSALRPGDGRLFGNGSGAVLIQRVAPETVQLRRWDLAGTLAEDVRLTVPLGDIDFSTILVEGSTVWGIGRTATNQPVLRRRAGEPGFTALGARELRSFFRSPLLRLRPGVLGVLEMKRTKRDCFQAALATSEDEGLSWGPERVLRPQGGCLQLTWGAAADGTGLAVTLSDNDAFRAWESADGVTQAGDFLFPAHDTVFLHVPLP